jgi:hypothetical protein
VTRELDDEGRQPVDPDRKAAVDDDQGDAEPLGRDERVSGYPLSFEEVVRAVHRTPRLTDKTLPKRKPGKEPDSK